MSDSSVAELPVLPSRRATKDAWALFARGRLRRCRPGASGYQPRAWSASHTPVLLEGLRQVACQPHRRPHRTPRRISLVCVRPPGPRQPHPERPLDVRIARVRAPCEPEPPLCRWHLDHAQPQRLRVSPQVPRELCALRRVRGHAQGRSGPALPQEAWVDTTGASMATRSKESATASMSASVGPSPSLARSNSRAFCVRPQRGRHRDGHERDADLARADVEAEHDHPLPPAVQDALRRPCRVDRDRISPFHSANRVNFGAQSTGTTPSGPPRCFAMWISLRPAESCPFGWWMNATTSASASMFPLSRKSERVGGADDLSTARPT